MDTGEIETLLSGGEETQTLEFKRAGAWETRLFVKDILAMANSFDGGKIIIGVDDSTFDRTGLTDEQLATFDIERMRDQIGRFADPFVQFSCEQVADEQGLQFIVIGIQPFTEIPVICARDGHDVHQGRVYYRGRTRRPESAPVSNSNDMRELIEISISRRMARMESMGFTVRNVGPDRYADEIGDL